MYSAFASAEAPGSEREAALPLQPEDKGPHRTFDDPIVCWIREDLPCMSVSPRLHRLFGADGNCFDVAIDHGFFNESTFLAGIEDMSAAVHTIVASAPDAIQL